MALESQITKRRESRGNVLKPLLERLAMRVRKWQPKVPNDGATEQQRLGRLAKS